MKKVENWLECGFSHTEHGAWDMLVSALNEFSSPLSIKHLAVESLVETQTGYDAEEQEYAIGYIINRLEKKHERV